MQLEPNYNSFEPNWNKKPTQAKLNPFQKYTNVLQMNYVKLLFLAMAIIILGEQKSKYNFEKSSN